MKFLETPYKRKSALITAIILMLLFLGILNFGMQYVDPPEEYGLAINFGDANFGAETSEVNSKRTSIANKEVPEENQKVVKEVAKPTEEDVKEVLSENILTSTTTKNVPVVNKEKTQQKAPLEKTQPVKEKNEEKPTEKLTEKPVLKPSKETQDALSQLLKGNSKTANSSGKGVAKEPVVKGKKEGAANTSKYYGNAASGAVGAYNLAGRNALSTPKKQPDCQETGTVVVKISVNNEGKVIEAIPGEKGTTNSSPCLFKPAKLAALQTKWNPDKDAPKIQTGTIIYKFTLSK